MRRQVVAGLLAAALSASSLSIATARADEVADSSALNSEDALQYGVDLSMRRQHQEFDDNSADLTTLAVQPYAFYGNWQFAVDMPWQKAEGGYFVNSFPPRLQYACDRVAKLTPKQLARHPKKAQLNEFCLGNGIGSSNIPDSVTGIGDVSVSARYGIALDDDAIWLLSIGGIYKFANGDASKNLGSGSRDSSLDMALGAGYKWWAGSLAAGYTWFDAGNTFSDRSGYMYAVADAALQPWRWLAIGCNYDYQQSYTRGVADMKKVSAYLRLKPGKQLGLKIYTSAYIDTNEGGGNDSYPDREYGISLTWSP